MPKLPGREPTRVTIPMEAVEVGSFIGVWERFAQGKVCCIEGCGHAIAGRQATREEVEAGAVYFIQCEGKTANTGAATVYDKRVSKADRLGHRGLLICPCCLEQLDEAWREMHGQPDA